MTHDAPTVSFGGPGGSQYVDICPRDEVLIGVQANVTLGEVAAIAARCGKINITPPDDLDAGAAATVRVRESTALPKRGYAEGMPVVSLCPANEVVTGFESYFDVSDAFRLRWFGLLCAPLSVTVRDGFPVVSLGNEHGLDPILEWAEMPGPPNSVSCKSPNPETPANLARGVLVRAGLRVDAVRLACAEPIIARGDGARCESHAGCASNRCSDCGAGCERTCQPHTCNEPNGCKCTVWDSREYLFCPEHASNHEASRQFCAAQGGQLLTLQSVTENGWTRSTATTWADMAGELWLDANDRDEEGTFRWADGSLADMDLWPATPPMGEELDCLQLNADGQWRSGRCEDARPYVCEFR